VLPCCPQPSSSQVTCCSWGPQGLLHTECVSPFHMGIKSKFYLLPFLWEQNTQSQICPPLKSPWVFPAPTRGCWEGGEGLAPSDTSTLSFFSSVFVLPVLLSPLDVTFALVTSHCYHCVCLWPSAFLLLIFVLLKTKQAHSFPLCIK
jgi:hypothetical protein